MVAMCIIIKDEEGKYRSQSVLNSAAANAFSQAFKNVFQYYFSVSFANSKFLYTTTTTTTTKVLPALYIGYKNQNGSKSTNLKP